MADLNNLLGELEAEEQGELFYNGDEDGNKGQYGRPSVETEATEPMTAEGWGSPDNNRRYVDVPVALKEAERRKNEGDYQENEQEAAADVDFWTGDITATQEGQHEINELYTKLDHFWHQEKNCPEILEYDNEMVEQIKDQMKLRQEWIDQMLEDAAEATGSNAGESSVQQLLATLAQVDLDRVKYVLANWMAERLAKVEAHPLHMREKVEYLSDAELSYLKEYGALLEDHLRQTVLDHIPEAWQGLDEANMIDQPDYEGYHFWLIHEPIEVNKVEHAEGSCLVAKYSVMREFMMEGKVEIQL